MKKHLSENFFNKTSFLDQWHFIDDIYPEHDETVWFTAGDKMYVGTYNEIQGAFIMADGEGVSLNDVHDWKSLGNDKKVASYPKEKDIVAAEIPGLSSLVMGIFTDHAIDDSTGDEVSAILLDDVYVGLPEAIAWKGVFSWYLLPESPVSRVTIKNLNSEPTESFVDLEFEECPDDFIDFEDSEDVPEVEDLSIDYSKNNSGSPGDSVIENEALDSLEDDDKDFTSKIKSYSEEEKEEESKEERVYEGRHKTVQDREVWYDEYNPKLPESAREFARWWYHDMLGDEVNPDFKKEYASDAIDDVDATFEKYLGSKYTTSHDVGFLYKMCSEEGQKKLDDIMNRYKALTF